jgi:hypothetical protein
VSNLKPIDVLRHLEWCRLWEIDYGTWVRTCPSCEGIDPSDTKAIEELSKPYVSDEEYDRAEKEGRLSGPGFYLTKGKSFMSQYKPTVGHEVDCELAAVLGRRE